MISGTQSPGGRIDVQDLNTGQTMVAVDAGDYVYPSDVRLNTQTDLLYVKASGLAGGTSRETWLFEYDLRAQRLVARQQVASDDLPAECTDVSKPN